MRWCVIDFELYSACDLKKDGADVYAHHPTTKILCVSIKPVVDGVPKKARCLRGEALKPPYKGAEDLWELANDPEVIFVAHHAGFEVQIWEVIMVALGWPSMPPERWHDTMAAAAMRALPLGLDAVGNALGLNVRKDMHGHHLMMRVCRPNKHGVMQISEHELLELMDYCNQDAESQYAVHKRIGGLGPAERRNWLLDQKICRRGFLIDREFVRKCQALIDTVKVPMTKRFREITKGLNPTQRDKLMYWLAEQGLVLENLRKETVEKLLKELDDPDPFEEPLSAEVHEALTLRKALASSSVAKLQRMLDCSQVDGRVRYAMQYHGAQTGRASGRLVQVQNYPRGTLAAHHGVTPEMLAEAIQTGDVQAVRRLWCGNAIVWEPMIYDAIISSLRSCIIPSKGRVLVAGDYASVEARLAMAYCGQWDRLKQMHAGVDVYSEMASLIYGKPINKHDNPEERHTGKSAVLGALYGLGAIGFHNRAAPNQTVAFADHVIQTYRKQFAPRIVNFWYSLFRASADAVHDNTGRTYAYEGIEFRKASGFLTMKLPSDRLIYYPLPMPEEGYNPVTGEKTKAWSYMTYSGNHQKREMAWHGTIMNHLCQGTARDLMFDASHKAEAAGIPIVFTVHDELVGEPKRGKDWAVILKQCMEDLPSWARERGFLITAEVSMMERYGKG